MTRKTSRARVDRDRASSFADAGDQFLREGELAGDREHWNAASVLLVHGCIALADAVCISRGGVKSTSDRHEDLLLLLAELSGGVKGAVEARTHLERVLRLKTRVSYEGLTAGREDFAALRKHADRFRAWAETVLGR